MKTNISDWLNIEIKRRGWNQSDLARYSGLSNTAISNFLSETRKPGPEALNAIARAFKLSPETVFRIAGILPEAPEIEIDTQEIIDRFQNAPQNIQEDILEYIRYRTRESGSKT